MSSLSPAQAGSSSSPRISGADDFANTLSRMPENLKVRRAGGLYRNSALARPGLTIFYPDETIVFQVIRVEEGQGSHQGIIYVFGITKEGSTVLAAIHDYVQPFYLECPQDFPDEEFQRLQEHINGILNAPIIAGIERVRLVATARRYEGWFLKFNLADPSRMKELQDKFTHGILQYKSWFAADWNFTTYEMNIPYLVSFIRSHQIHTLSWVKVSPDTYEPYDHYEMAGRCDAEVRMLDGQRPNVLSKEEVEAQGLPKIASLRILSFDIETTVPATLPDGSTPLPDPISQHIIQISSILTTRYGSDSSSNTDPHTRIIFTLQDCDPIEGAQTLCFASEKEMIEHWQAFVLGCDPDVVMGFNSCRFDLTFYLSRAKELGCPEVGLLGRIQDRQAARCLRWTPWNVPFYNALWPDVPLIQGRITFDLLDFANRKVPAPRKLDQLCERLLKENKVGIPFTEIPTTFNRGPDGRRELALYCLKDSYLVQRLFDHLRCLEVSAEDARELCIPMEWMMTRFVRDTDMFKDFQRGLKEGFIVPDRQYPKPLAPSFLFYF